MDVQNKTPFPVETCGVMDHNDRNLLVVLCKVTFDLTNPHDPVIAEEQIPVVLEDQYAGEPDSSGLAYASDLSMGKPATDIALAGYVYPQKPGDGEAMLGLRVGKLQKTVLVYGDREWTSNLGLFGKTKPKPFERIPIQYERAYGGRDDSTDKPDFEPRNPVGVGFRTGGSKLNVAGSPLPNFEDPNHLIKSPADKPPPAGFGFIPPGWQPRIQYAGTYDEAWRESRMPLLPKDFDVRYFDASPADLIYDGYLQGGESVVLVGVAPDGPLNFHLPTNPFRCHVMMDHEPQPLELVWDRLFIDAESRKLVAVWSGLQPLYSDPADLGAIIIEAEV